MTSGSEQTIAATRSGGARARSGRGDVVGRYVILESLSTPGDRVLRQSIDDASEFALNNLGSIHSKLGHDEQALAMYERALDVLETGRRRQARALLGPAVELLSDSPRNRDVAAQLLERAERETKE